MRPIAILAIALATAVQAPLLAQSNGGPDDIALLMSSNSCETCNCYWSTDCSSGQSCNYNGCTHVGKLDGVCKSSGSGGWELPDLPLAADGVGDYFRGFVKSAQDITGATVPQAAEELKSAHRRRLTLQGHLSLRMLSLDALDVVVGFDLVAPTVRFCSAAGPVPTFRGHLDAATEALLAATEAGLRAAIVDNDPNRIRQALRQFWAKYPDYEPDHSGRCYRHGHDDFPYESPEACQVDELTRLLRVHLPPRS